MHMLGQKRGTFFKYYFLTVAFEPVALVITAKRGPETVEASWPDLSQVETRRHLCPGSGAARLAAVDVGPWPGCTGPSARGRGRAGTRLPPAGRRDGASRCRLGDHCRRGAFLGPGSPPAHPPWQEVSAPRPPLQSLQHWLKRHELSVCSLGEASGLAAQWPRRLGGAHWLGGWEGVGGTGDRALHSSRSPLVREGPAQSLGAHR